MSRDPARLESDWNAWAAGSRGVEIERLERELAESRAREIKARHEATETRERFERLLDASKRFARTLSDRRRQQQTSRQYLAVQHAIDGVLAGADDLEDAAAGVLKTLGENFGWQVAVFWVAGDETLRCVEIWHRTNAAPDGFVEACRRTNFVRGEGLPGSAWAENRSVWAGCRLQEERFGGVAASAGGLHSALAFPITAGGSPRGVIELLGNEIMHPDKVLLYTVGLIGGQLGQFADRRSAKEERDRLHSLEVSLHAEAAERERISRELHDRVAHSMGVAHQSLQLYEALAEKDPVRAHSKLHTAKEMTKTALEQTRNLSMELRHPETENGLVPALRDLLEVAVPDDVSTELSTSGAESRLSDHQRGQLYLILREAVRNAVRHSGCRRLTVGLDITSENVSGYVEDDGFGFEGNGGARDGLGLRSTRERVALLEGTAELYSPQKGGAGVQVRLPLRNGGG